MAGELPFEKPLGDLRRKIEELKGLSQGKGIDFSDEIARLEARCRQLEEELYSELGAAEKMHLARHHQRPTSLDFIQAIFTDFLELHGDRLFADDLAIVGGLAKLNGMPVTVIGHQRGKDTKDNIARFFGSPHPEGFRKALRLMQQADKFRRPIITFIDTKGAYPGNTAEERGQSEAIARNLREMALLGVPVICVVIGEGGSGGALALGVGNRVLMLENAIYSVISPNGAASILWKDASKADQAAEAMKITAKDLLSFGIIEEVVPEPQGGAHRDYEQQAESIKEAVWRHLQELLAMSAEELVEDRYMKFRKIGRFAFAAEAGSEQPDGALEAPEAAGLPAEAGAEPAAPGDASPAAESARVH
ncbi:acetyl-CoA carboxylase carboxyltransferase subunit alpha [Paenibacillus pasadenensis]|uniref:Acetyl-coenzyme A carboxylase carboxyl transferase subunit alpha n=1 Tax=Paenibacillus pasadenensis TaxID=217090 RepID=A0A2N5N9J7_9BACL|nr:MULTISPECIES: acetyl-CoA carboxylase carboxyltransferase subunit alpha [Paenibacillus]PLT46998.1 Acetyl-coenzyme A carboxyl transferase alpha chain [Paenibacillus pasadenensis]QGG57337.1 acetyl-CoA carboxylase carboxyltransferase subunit alpha [Paenibacillus sp. B01]